MYTDRSKVEALTGYDLSSISSAVTEWCQAVSDWIDKYCDRSFDATQETRYYDGNGRNTIIIDSFVGTPSEVSVLNNDGTVHKTLTEGAGADYVAYPLNGVEKYEIALMTGSPVRGFSRALFEDILDDEDLNDPAFTTRRLLKVTATFGASADVPAPVQLVATKLVGRLATQRMKGSEGGVKSEKLGDYAISFGDIDQEADALGVYQTLDMYREPTL